MSEFASCSYLKKISSAMGNSSYLLECAWNGPITFQSRGKAFLSSNFHSVPIHTSSFKWLELTFLFRTPQMSSIVNNCHNSLMSTPVFLQRTLPMVLRLKEVFRSLLPAKDPSTQHPQSSSRRWCYRDGIDIPGSGYGRGDPCGTAHLVRGSATAAAAKQSGSDSATLPPSPCYCLPTQALRSYYCCCYRLRCRYYGMTHFSEDRRPDLFRLADLNDPPLIIHNATVIII